MPNGAFLFLIVMAQTKWIVVGEIYREHGIHGALSCHLYSGSAANLPVGTPIRLTSKGGETSTTLLKIAPQGKRFLISCEGFTNPEQARLWRKSEIAIETQALLPLRPQEYYLQALLGFEAMENSNRLGEIVGVQGSGKILFLAIKSSAGSTVLLPFENNWICGVDESRRLVFFDLPEGLWETLHS